MSVPAPEVGAVEIPPSEIIVHPSPTTTPQNAAALANAPDMTASAFDEELPRPVAVGRLIALPARPERPSGAFCVNTGIPRGPIGRRVPPLAVGESWTHRGRPNGWTR